MKKIGFDSQMYMQKQSEQILERISKFDKLYLEFGGKLFDDLHKGRLDGVTDMLMIPEYIACMLTGTK